MDIIHLSGADDVRRAGHTISGAADVIQRAATTIDNALQMHRMGFDETVQKFCNAIACIGTIEGMKAENKVREQVGSVAYGEDAFQAVLTQYGLV